MKRIVFLSLCLLGVLGTRVGAQTKHFSDPFSLYETGVGQVRAANVRQGDKYYDTMKYGLAALWDLLPQEAPRKTTRDIKIYTDVFNVSPESVKLQQKLPQFEAYATQCEAQQKSDKEAYENLQKQFDTVQDQLKGGKDSYAGLEKQFADIENEYKELQARCGQSTAAYQGLAQIVNTTTSIQSTLTDAVEVLRLSTHASEAEQAALAQNVKDVYAAFIKAQYLRKSEGEKVSFSFLADEGLIDAVVNGQLSGHDLEQAAIRTHALDQAEREDAADLSRQLAQAAQLLAKRVQATMSPAGGI